MLERRDWPYGPTNKVQAQWFDRFEGDDPVEARATTTRVWETVAKELMPMHVGIGWDHLRLEIWTDSGRTILFPRHSRLKRRIDIGSITIEWDMLKSAFLTGDVAEPDEDDFLAQAEEPAGLAAARRFVVEAFGDTYVAFGPQIGLVRCLEFGETLVTEFRP